jgi:predicted dehydrogenase
VDKVRIAVIGIGGMGEHHCRSFKDVQGAELAAVCDVDSERLKAIRKEFDVPSFSDFREVLKGDVCDAVLIATPHYFHPPFTIEAFRAGKHVLSEKPVGVYTLQAEEAAREHTKYPDLIYAIMFQMRAAGINKKVKDLIDSGEIGKLTRVLWINTDWFRTQAYYDSGGWRATWAGEGGGVLLNQAPHSMDLLQWLTGMPRRVRAFMKLGLSHNIEVEDDVTAYLEWENGATGVFLTSTCEAPGTGRQEIIGTQGKIVIEKGTISLSHNRTAMDEFIHKSEGRFDPPETWTMEIPPARGAGVHQEITQNFVNAILKKEPLISPGEEGIRSLSLANAMILSSLKDKWVDIPFDGVEYKSLLDDLCAKSTLKKSVRTAGAEDMNASFH